jgi:rod shape determining protein RodA
MVISILGLSMAGLVTMSSFQVNDSYFWKQSAWIIVALSTYSIASRFDYRFLRDTRVVVAGYSFLLIILSLLFVIGHVAKGAQSWFHVGGFSFQPSDLMKLGLIIVLAKYFSRRHIEIANSKHVIVSGVYALIPFLLVAVQPALGSALVLFFIWFGMVLVSGISKRHIMAVGLIGVVLFSLAWEFAFLPYQKARIVSFISPLEDIKGSGYHVYQSMIAVGSGGLFGKGVGYGTQSRLSFLPEYKTDFIFAAYTEEWGFIGALFIIFLYGLVLYRLSYQALLAESNFEALFTYGVMTWFFTHAIINIGMNIGVMPVTGIPLPFMSYGGSHLLAESLALGMCAGMYRYARSGHQHQKGNEFLGLE